jgi:uridine kinase
VRFSQLDQVLCKVIWGLNHKEEQLLFLQSSRDCLHRHFFGSHDRSRLVFEQRLEAWRNFLTMVLSRRVPPSMLTGLRPWTIWSYAFAIAQHILQTNGQIFGIAGPPGAGKTTLVGLLVSCLTSLDAGSKVLAVSLDDFYYTKAERRARGIKWRAQPGSHNLAAATAFLRSIRRRRRLLRVPRFDPATDDVGPVQTIRGPVSVLLMDGWFLGMNENGYDRISELIDILVYIDCPLELAKRRRFARESRIRTAANGRRGFSTNEMARFWKEILEPGIRQWVEPVRRRADLVIELGLRGEVLAEARRRHRV